MNFKKWELALAIGLICAVLLGASALAHDAALADKLVRLHVLAASDSAEDQALKLKVRDEILLVTEPLLSGCEDAGGAQEAIRRRLPDIEARGQAVVDAEGSGYRVHAELTETDFPSRDYGTFALPAGRYTALRVVIGPGQGQNWWCVVFPPLCAAAASEDVSRSAYSAGMDEQDVGLMVGGSEGYVLRFKLLEWYGALKKSLGFSRS